MYRHIHNTLYRNLADQSEIGYIHEMSEKKCYRGLFMNTYKLSLHINDQKHYEWFVWSVMDLEWRAVVSMNTIYDGWELLSYQHIF